MVEELKRNNSELNLDILFKESCPEPSTTNDEASTSTSVENPSSGNRRYFVRPPRQKEQRKTKMNAKKAYKLKKDRSFLDFMEGYLMTPVDYDDDDDEEEDEDEKFNGDFVRFEDGSLWRWYTDDHAQYYVPVRTNGCSMCRTANHRELDFLHFCHFNNERINYHYDMIINALED